MPEPKSLASQPKLRSPHTPLDEFETLTASHYILGPRHLIARCLDCNKFERNSQKAHEWAKDHSSDNKHTVQMENIQYSQYEGGKTHVDAWCDAFSTMQNTINRLSAQIIALGGTPKE